MHNYVFNTYYKNVDVEYWQCLCVNEGILRTYERGELFAEQGRVAKYVGYIKKGSLKYVVYTEDGTEAVVGLEFAGGFVADFPFSLFAQKSRVNIVAVTQCEIYCVPTVNLINKLKSDNRFFTRVAETSIALFDTVYNRYVDLYTKSAQERYNELIERYDDIFSIFSLKDIASFLNITPTHLSRLRKNSNKPN